MRAEENARLVSRIADDIWNRGDLEAIDEVMAPDARYHGPHMPGGTGGREDWRQHIARARSAFPDSHVAFEELICSGDTVVGRWSATGTHQGNFAEIAPTGRRIVIGGITIYRIVEGTIVEAWEQLDMLGMWQQLDVLAAPGGPPRTPATD